MLDRKYAFVDVGEHQSVNFMLLQKNSASKLQTFLFFSSDVILMFKLSWAFINDDGGRDSCHKLGRNDECPYIHQCSMESKKEPMISEAYKLKCGRVKILPSSSRANNRKPR